MATSSPLALPLSLALPYAISLLVLIFLAIVTVFNVVTGFLAWALGGALHLKTVVVTRLKDEFLELGVISLVLAFMEPALTKVCVPGVPPEEAIAEGEGDQCEEGHRQLFPESVITSSHYLLFWIAVLQIGYSLLMSIFASLRFNLVSRWEQILRTNLAHVAKPGKAGREQRNGPRTGMPSPTRTAARLEEGISDNDYNESSDRSYRNIRDWPAGIWVTATGGLNEGRYSVLRNLLLLRVMCDPHAYELRTVNLAVAAEQLIYRNLNRAHAHTWLQLLVVTLLMLYVSDANQFVWVNPAIFVLTIILVAKLEWSIRKAVKIARKHLGLHEQQGFDTALPGSEENDRIDTHTDQGVDGSANRTSAALPTLQKRDGISDDRSAENEVNADAETGDGDPAACEENGKYVVSVVQLLKHLHPEEEQQQGDEQLQQEDKEQHQAQDDKEENSNPPLAARKQTIHYVGSPAPSTPRYTTTNIEMQRHGNPADSNRLSGNRVVPLIGSAATADGADHVTITFPDTMHVPADGTPIHTTTASALPAFTSNQQLYSYDRPLGATDQPGDANHTKTGGRNHVQQQQMASGYKDAPSRNPMNGRNGERSNDPKGSKRGKQAKYRGGTDTLKKLLDDSPAAVVMGAADDGEVSVGAPHGGSLGHHADSKMAFERSTTVSRNPQMAIELSELEGDFKSVFWFGWPDLMIWLLELIIVVSASVITLIAFFLGSPGAGTTSIDATATETAVWAVLIVFNVLLCMYLGWVIIPQYALLHTAAVESPQLILEHLRYSKIMANEEEHGLDGATTEMFEAASRKQKLMMKQYRIWQHHRRSAKVHEPQQENQNIIRRISTAIDDYKKHKTSKKVRAGQAKDMSAPAEPTSPNNPHVKKVFEASRLRLMGVLTASLALRAGVILPAHHIEVLQRSLSRCAPLFLGLISVWRHKALVFMRKAESPPNGYVVKGGIWLAAFHEVFHTVDITGSGTLSSYEFQEHMREAFNVRLTHDDLEAMKLEIGSAGPPIPANEILVESAVHLRYNSSSDEEEYSDNAQGPTLRRRMLNRLGIATNMERGKRAVTLQRLVYYAAFCFLDHNQKRVIDKRSVHTILSAYGVEVPGWQLDTMLQMASPDGKGEVRSSQFLQLFDDVELTQE